MNIVNVFKLHYFLYWGSISGVLNYTLLLINKYGKVNQNETGVLYSILPIMILIAKPLFCSAADKYAFHEWVLVGTIISQTVSYGFLAILPFITLKWIVWPIFCILMLIGNASNGVLTSITDSMVMKVAETESSNFGQMRVWGTIGWGLISYIVGYINDKEEYNIFPFLPLYTPGFLLFVILQIIDLILILTHIEKLRAACRQSDFNRERRPTIQEAIEQSISQSFKIQNVNGNGQLNNSVEKLSIKNENESVKSPKKQIIKFFLLTCWTHPMLIKYIFICVIVGLCTSLNWNFYSAFLNILRKDDTKLVGLTAAVQCFASEMPFMYFSGYFIDKIGSKASFSIVLFTFALRFFLYSFFNTATAYYILIVELAHGITFGLFYYNMNILARNYSKKMYKVEYNYLIKNVYKRNDLTVEDGDTTADMNEIQKTVKLAEEDDSTFSTMQSIMSGAFEGFGIAIGSLIAGLLIEAKGFKFLWLFVSGIAFVVFLADLLLMSIIFIRNKYRLNIKSESTIKIESDIIGG